MASAEEGGATTNTTTSSSYGGGGGSVGGKFRNRPFRKRTTPYDRPLLALPGDSSNGSWLKKLVLDPASKIISYGAHRLFATRRRLTRPPSSSSSSSSSSSQKSDLNHAYRDGRADAVSNSQYSAKEPAGGVCSQPRRSSGNNGIAEFEQLLKQKTFTRSEIDHLTEVLHSRAGEISLTGDKKRNVESASDLRRSRQYQSSLLEANRNEGGRSHGVVAAPISNSKVLGDSVASPAAVAKADMSMALTTKVAFSSGGHANGSITAPRSRGRSAICDMARSPYWKFQGSGINHNGYAGLTMPSASLSLVENSERPEPVSMKLNQKLKRRSHVLDDEVGSVGPIRRIRQKSNLISSGISQTDGLGVNSDAVIVSSKQKLLMISYPEHIPNTVDKADNCIPSTSNAQVSSNSFEVAARKSEHLEKLTPKEKSSESMVVAMREKSPFKLTSSMLRGRALRSMEDISSSEFLFNAQDDHKFESMPNATFSDTQDSSSQEQGKVEENGPVGSFVSPDAHYPVIDSDSAVSLKASWVRNGTSDSVVENGTSQPQYKRAFRMSAPEDYVELDDDIPCNGLASLPLFEKRGQMEVPLTDDKIPPAGEPKPFKKTTQPEVKSPSRLVSSKTSELNGSVSSEEINNGITTRALEEVTVAAQSAVLPPPVAASDKPNDTSSTSPLFSFSSKVADKFFSTMSESSSRTPETKPESSSSLVNISAPTCSVVKMLEPEKCDHLKPLAPEDRTGKNDAVLSPPSNGLLVSRSSIGSFAPACSITNHFSVGGPAIFTTSTSISTFAPSSKEEYTLAASSGSIFGAAKKPTVSGGPVFNFGASSNPSSEASTGSTSVIPAGDLETKAVTNPSSASSSSSQTNVVVFGTPSSGNTTSGFSSSASFSTANGVETASQGNSIQPFSFASQSSSMNSSTLVSTSSNSQVINPIMPFSFNSSASSSSTGTTVSSNGPTSSLFGLNPIAASGGSAGSSTAVATPDMFSFGTGSLSSTNAIGSTGGAAPSIFSFGLSSSASTSVTNTASPFSTSTAGPSTSASPVFGFGASSSVSPSVSNTTSIFTTGASGVFNFGGSSSASFSATNPNNSDSAPNPFGSSWQAPKSPVFGTSASQATGFSFGTSTGPSLSLSVPFTASSSVLQPVFGNPVSGFSASPGNNDQMNGEDSMAEDPVQSNAPSIRAVGQSSMSPSPPAYAFGLTTPSQANPFQFGGQQNQVAPQNPLMFQASGSLEFNAGGSFSLGSGAGDKSGRKFVKASKSRNRKK